MEKNVYYKFIFYLDVTSYGTIASHHCYINIVITMFVKMNWTSEVYEVWLVVQLKKMLLSFAISIQLF